MSIDLFGAYKKGLIKEGAKSKRLKGLPKDVNKLTISEFYFLMDYINKGIEKFTKQ